MLWVGFPAEVSYSETARFHSSKEHPVPRPVEPWCGFHLHASFEVNGQAMHPLSLSRLRASLKCVLPRWAGPKDLELDSLPPFLGTDRDDHGHRGSQARDAGHRGGQEEEANAACMHTQVFFQAGASIRMCSLHVGSS